MTTTVQPAADKTPSGPPNREEGGAPLRLLRLDAAWGSHPGVARGYNEDTILGTPGDPPPPRGSLYLVADGMGGHNAGEVASEGAGRRTYEGYYLDTDPNVHRSLDKVIRLANAELYAQAQANPAQHGMGTTLTSVVIQGDRAYIAHVGDSRLYRVRGGKAEQLTQDHSWVAEQVRAGVLSPDQAEVHPQRNVITRALATAPDVKVDHSDADLQVGDVLVLCSDGLSTEVGENQIAALSTKAATAQEAVQRLIKLANDNGGEDNISVAVIRVAGEGSGALPAAVGEGVTERVPVVPGRRLRRGFPWLFIGVAAALLLLAGGLAGYFALLRREVPPASAIPGEATPAGPAVTSTLMPAQLTGGVTAETPTSLPANTPGAVDSASSAQTVAPTETLAPTRPPQPEPSRASSTGQEPAKQAEPGTGAQPVAGPALGNPASGAIENAPSVLFSWSTSGHTLQEGEGYALFVWPVGDRRYEGCEGWACPTVFPACGKPYTETAATVTPSNALEGFPGSGDYYWTVMVVNTQLGETGGEGRCRLVSDRPLPNRFKYTAPTNSDKGEPGNVWQP